MIAPARTGSDQLTCVICDAENSAQQGYCIRCLTPLDVSQSVHRRGTPPRFMSVLGASAAGKTVYLGMLLDMLGHGAGGLRGLPNGAFAVNMPQQTTSALESRFFPEKTPSEADHWRWVHCEVVRGNKHKTLLDIVTPDFAGEAIAIEVEQPGTYPTIKSVVGKSAAIMLLVDSLRIRDSARDEDYFALKLASYIADLHTGGKAKRRVKTPLAIVLTKADACPEALEDPQRFASTGLPGLTSLCRSRFANHHVFGAAVAGATATVTNDHGYRLAIPLHVEPRGVIEPLQWIVKRV